MASSTLLCPKLGTCAVSLSTSTTSHAKIQPFHIHSLLSPMGRRLFSPWNGLKQVGISSKPKPLLHIGKYNITINISFGIVLFTRLGFFLVWLLSSFFLHFADRKGRRCKGMVVYASLFGVGAPEALVIGVVALLVFGPKGLAEVSFTCVYTILLFGIIITNSKSLFWWLITFL